jgi:hypothetical protein
MDWQDKQSGKGRTSVFDGAATSGTAEDDEGRPDLRPGKPYRAFGHPRSHALRSLFLYFNAEERKKYGKKKMQIQYEHLDSDDPTTEGFASDGQSFSFVVSGARKMMRITVHGRQLEEGYDFTTFHRTPWMRSFDGRDFGQLEGPVIFSFDIEVLKDEEESREGTADAPLQRNRVTA